MTGWLLLPFSFVLGVLAGLYGPRLLTWIKESRRAPTLPQEFRRNDFNPFSIPGQIAERATRARTTRGRIYARSHRRPR